ncbi:hypothetical protein [Paenibacillus sp. GYB003]|uniref:hypothetical protein n=1 Tax=Paenibacillus sp. GYB003 TaxID=2994392 RepID=UPI002F96AF69
MRDTRIDDMMPGRELDQHFANLIGYQSLTTAMNLDGSYGYTPKYSTTWEGMGEVIGEMQRRGYSYSIHNTEKGVWVQFEQWSPEYDLAGFGKSEAESAPYAVALAAIKALQGEDTTNEKNG